MKTKTYQQKQQPTHFDMEMENMLKFIVNWILAKKNSFTLSLAPFAFSFAQSKYLNLLQILAKLIVIYTWIVCMCVYINIIIM